MAKTQGTWKKMRKGWKKTRRQMGDSMRKKIQQFQRRTRPRRTPGLYDIWPSDEQRLLLRACLLPAEKAIPAWREWRRRVDFLNLDSSSNLLLPLLYLNLHQGVSRDAWMERLKGIYRYAWTTNQLQIRQLEEILIPFNQQQIPNLLLKGAAVLLQHYRDMGSRSMSDFDILVPCERLDETDQMLRQQGWVTPRFSLQYMRDWHSATPYVHPRGKGIDLHWHILPSVCSQESTSSFWQEARKLVVGQTETLALRPEYQLFHACVHGMRYSPDSPFRWLADCYKILQTSGHVMEGRLLAELSERTRHLLPLTKTFDYLERELDYSIPESLKSAIAGRRITWFERLEYPGVIHRPGVWPTLWVFYFRHRRVKRERGGKLFQMPLLVFQQMWRGDKANTKEAGKRHAYELIGFILRRVRHVWVRLRHQLRLR